MDQAFSQDQAQARQNKTFKYEVLLLQAAAGQQNASRFQNFLKYDKFNRNSGYISEVVAHLHIYTGVIHQ